MNKMFLCRRSSVKNDKFSSFSDACYTANINKLKEQLRKNKSRAHLLVNQREENGATPLHYAAQKGDPQTISFLITQHADPMLFTKAGEIPLHVACFHRKKAAVECLLPAMKRNHIDTQDFQRQMTSLHVAICRGCPEITELLLYAGADPTLCDRSGNNALELAELCVGQANAGLTSRAAKHHQTLLILKKNLRNVNLLKKQNIENSAHRYSTAIAAS